MNFLRNWQPSRHADASRTPLETEGLCTRKKSASSPKEREPWQWKAVGSNWVVKLGGRAWGSESCCVYNRGRGIWSSGG